MMIKLKNLLAENMFRFRTKNISESTVRQKLTEATEAVNTTFSLPTKKDATGKLVYNKTGMIKYIAVAIQDPKVPGSTNHDNFKNFASLSVNGTPVKLTTSIKKPNGDITGAFYVNETAFNYLMGEVGKTATDVDAVYFSANLNSGGTDIVYAAYKVNTYEVQTSPAPAPVKKD